MPTDVSANPLNVVISLAYAPYNAGATQNGQYQIVSQSLEAVLPLLPSSLASQLSPITPFLGTPLGQLFNNDWANLLPTEQSTLANQFIQAASGAGQGVSNVSCTLASSGTVLAAVATPRARPGRHDRLPPARRKLPLQLRTPGRSLAAQFRRRPDCERPRAGPAFQLFASRHSDALQRLAERR